MIGIIATRRNYALTIHPPAAKSAAAPIAPVLMGAHALALLKLDFGAEAALAEEAPAAAPPPRVDVGVGIPDVKGTLDETAVAPEKATDWEVAVASGVADVALGLRTLERRERIRFCGKRNKRQGIILLVNHVYDTISDKDIRNDDLGTIDKVTTICNGDGQFLAVHSGKLGAVTQAGAISDSTVDNCDIVNSKKVETRQK